MNLNRYADKCHEAAQSWWRNPATGERIERNKGELIALMHSELSELLEAERKNLRAEHINPELFTGAEEELADLLIRAFDYAAAHGFKLPEAFDAKLAFNAKRADHTAEARLGKHGKVF